MHNSRFFKSLAAVLLALMVLVIPLTATGCAQKQVTGPAADFVSAKVPDLPLDAYFYINQGTPTKVPGNLIGSGADISVQSLSLWGIVNSDNAYALAGVLNFTNPSDAGRIYSQIPLRSNTWTKLDNAGIFFVYGLGGPAQSLQNAIENNHFKAYDDSKVLSDIALMPLSGSARPAAIGIIKPNKAMIDLLSQYSQGGDSRTMNMALTWSRPQVIVFGLYSSQPIDIAETINKMNNNTLQDADLGAIVSINFGYPGFIVSPLAGRLLESAGLTQQQLNALNVYETQIAGGSGRNWPVYVTVDGNHVYTAVSPRESYAQTLIAAVKR